MSIKYFNDPARLWGLTKIMLGGVQVTLGIFVLTLILSIPLGMLVALGRMSKRKALSTPVSFYIYIMRGTPLMLQVLFFWFFLSQSLPFKPSRFAVVVFSFALNYAAYFAEIFRGGIQAVPVGQREAGQVLGYTRVQTFFRIIVPQVVRNVLPAVTNEIITLVKDTALGSIIAVVELMSIAKKQVSNSTSIEPYVVAILLYLLLNGIAERLCKTAERKMDYLRR